MYKEGDLKIYLHIFNGSQSKKDRAEAALKLCGQNTRGKDQERGTPIPVRRKLKQEDENSEEL